MEQALEGVRVLDLSEGIAGPVAAKFLGDFGAEVIKVESPTGDWSRMRGPFPGDQMDNERSALFMTINRNKLGITLDVFKSEGRAILDRLIADADILVLSYTPRQIEELGLDYDSLAKINPAIVVTAITPWGLTGPYRDYAASEIVLDAFGHAMAAFGVKDREPLAMGGGLRQHYAGRFAALASLAAYVTAERSGVGQMVDVSMIETQLASPDRRAAQLQRFEYIRRLYYRQDTGIGTGNLRGGYQLCADGWVHVALQPADFVKLAPIIGHPEWVEDPRFQPIEQHFPTNALQEELGAAFLTWSLTRTRKEIVEIVRPHRLPVYPVNYFSDVLEDEHLAEREFWVDQYHEMDGTHRYPGAPFRLARAGYQQRRAAPMLGQHNADIYRGRLGMTNDEVRDLEGRGIVERSNAAQRFTTSHVADPALPAPLRGSAKPELPLTGIRVLDMTAIWAGPAAAMLLADLGAEVIRVESSQFAPMTTRGVLIHPQSYDELEKHPNPFANSYVDFDPGERPWNRFGGFNAFNRNKRSVTADLRRPEGVEIFKKLVSISDVVLDNYAFGVMERMGLGDGPLREVNPRLINISMPLQGNSGPLKAATGTGAVVDSWSGFLAMRGYRDFDVGNAQATFHMDSTTPPGVAFAVLCALREREQSGLGQFIDFSQAENMIQSVGEYFLDAQWNHRAPKALGNRDRWGAIQGCYRCTGIDQWVVLTARTDREWRALGRALGDPAWIAEPRFGTSAQRLAHHHEIDRLITEWSSTLDSAEAMQRLQAAGVPAARVLNERDAFSDPHLQARGFFIEQTQAEAGTHRHPGHQWKMLSTPLRHDRPAPLLGEDNKYVYQELLGYSDAEIQRLTDELHIGTDYVPGLRAGR